MGNKNTDIIIDVSFENKGMHTVYRNMDSRSATLSLFRSFASEFFRLVDKELV